MAKIIKFPRAVTNEQHCTNGPIGHSQQVMASPLPMRILWVLVVLLWPLLKWIMSIDCVIQLMLTIYRWHNTPIHAAFTFGIHFGALAAMTYFVACYKPKGI